MDFLFAVHNHQPVGNFAHDLQGGVRRTATGRCSKAWPRIRASSSPSISPGPLWEYMEKHERGCWDLVRELVGRGQVELLGGGFYEPILSVIPEEDRIGQVRMMSDFLAESIRPAAARRCG